MASLRNPYRISKPQGGIRWWGTLHLVTKKSLFNWGACTYKAVLTQQHLWLCRELAIPLQAIREVTTASDGRILRICFHQGLINQDLSLGVTMTDFFSRTDRQKLATLADVLNKAWQEAKAQAGQGSFNADLARLLREARCETCGSPNAALLESGYHFSMGLYPFFDIEHWNPARPYVCRRHAIMTTFWNNARTSLLGFWGLPGIFTGPFYLWKNISILHRLFHVSPFVMAAGMLSGLVIPISIYIALCRWLAAVWK